MKNVIRIDLDAEYTHMALVRTDGNASLLEIDAVRAMCQLESKLASVRGYKGFCQRKFYVADCCRPWSIPNYIAILSNKTACHEIEVKRKFNCNFVSYFNRKNVFCICFCFCFETKESDVLQMKQLLSDCHKYYIDGSLKSDCDNFKCVAPEKCMQFNAVFNILHFLADSGFNVSVSPCTTK